MPDSLIVLAIDTTSEFGSVALLRDQQKVSEIHLWSTDGFGPFVIQAIQEALAQANTRLDEIDCFAAANGPGSFTGVRVAVAAAKGLAEALGKPVAGVSNLRALSLCGHAHLRAVALDARRGQVYGAVYDASAKLVLPEVVSQWEEWLKSLPPDVEFIGLEGGPCQIAGVPFTLAPKYLAAAVGQCAALDGPAGWSDPIALDANYVRRSDAEMFWKDI